MRWATPRRSGSDLIKQSRICLIVAILKSLVSVLSVARGASDERERPIVHLGATFGSASGLATRSRQSRASFCPAFRSVLACLATGIDWFEDRFDAIAGDYDTATSGDAAGRTKRVGNVAAPCQRERPPPVSARRCWATDKSRSFCSSKSCSSKSSNSRQMIRFSVAMPRIGSPAEARSWWRRSRQAAASANRWWSEKVRASFTCLYSASVAHPGLAAFQCETIVCV